MMTDEHRALNIERFFFLCSLSANAQRQTSDAAAVADFAVEPPSSVDR